jgi:hypothetical protein
MKLIKQMMKEFKKKIAEWKADPEDLKYMITVYAEDRKNLTRVYNLLEKGKVKQAAKEAWSLDTIVRDQIPEDVYDFMEDATEECH